MKNLNPASEVPLSPCRRNTFAFTALLIIILSIYSNTFDASWHFDDLSNIVYRKAIHLKQLTWPDIKKTLFFDKDEQKVPNPVGLYRPVANFTFALNYYFGRLDVFGYHLVNISVHIMASMFLFLFIYQTLNLPLLRTRYGRNSYFIALLATVFWAINPVQTQAVTYIVQRMASMSAMFYIMSMYFYVKARISQKRSRKGLYFFWCLFTGILAVGTKENAVTIPITILIYDLFFVQGLTKENLKKGARILFILMAIPPIFALILKGPAIFDPNHILKQYESVRVFSLTERLLTEPRIILFYVTLLLYPMPHRLSICHDIDISHSLIDPPTTIIAICAILCVLGVCIIKSTRWPFISFCVIFFFLNHIIEGSIFGLELIFEHRNYLPSMLLFAPLAVLLVKGIGFWANANKRAMPVILSVFIIVVLIGFGRSTFMRNYTWKTDGPLWTDATEKAPDLTRPHMNLGCFLLYYKKYERALSEFTAAASGKILCNTSDRDTVLYNIGLVHHRKGNLDLALEYYRKSEKATYTAYADKYNNMGLILTQKGQREEAERAFLKALQCTRSQIQPYRNLSLMMLQDGRVEEALESLNLALRRWPNNMAILALAGYAHRFMGSYGKAFLLLERALNVKPYDPKIHLYMSEIYFKRGMGNEARGQIRQFIAREDADDLSVYIRGIANEDNNDVIKPFKKKVMQELAQTYEKGADFIMAKVRSLNGEVAVLHKSPEEENPLSPVGSKKEVKDMMEEMEVMDNARMVPAER